MSDNDPMLELLRTLHAQMSEQAAEIKALREAVIRIETHSFSEQIRDLRENNKYLSDKVLVLETQGKFFAAGVAAGVSILVSVMSAFTIHLFRP